MSDILFEPIKENMEVLFGSGVYLEALYKDKPTKAELKDICELLDLFEAVRGTLNSNYLEIINKMRDKNLFYNTNTRELHKFVISEDKVILALPKLI